MNNRTTADFALISACNAAFAARLTELGLSARQASEKLGWSEPRIMRIIRNEKAHWPVWEAGHVGTMLYDSGSGFVEAAYAARDARA